MQTRRPINIPVVFHPAQDEVRGGTHKKKPGSRKSVKFCVPQH